jgi:hypothetical protein
MALKQAGTKKHVVVWMKYKRRIKEVQRRRLGRPVVDKPWQRQGPRAEGGGAAENRSGGG